MNLSMVISVYASISRELGLPLRFPGTPNAYTALYQVTSADILARATEWATTSPSAVNEIFNVTNGDYFRWINLWPALARYFNMPCGPPRPTDSCSFTVRTSTSLYLPYASAIR
jgi:nucleoside-diphosphate-sugar epimerase